jgi:predicted sugar kinase
MDVQEMPSSDSLNVLPSMMTPLNAMQTINHPGMMKIPSVIIEEDLSADSEKLASEDTISKQDVSQDDSQLVESEISQSVKEDEAPGS